MKPQLVNISQAHCRLSAAESSVLSTGSRFTNRSRSSIVSRRGGSVARSRVLQTDHTLRLHLFTLSPPPPVALRRISCCKVSAVTFDLHRISQIHKRAENRASG